MGKTIEIRLKISEDELMELRESLDNSVRELSDELEECVDEDSDVTAIANKIKAAQSVRCKLAIQAAEPEYEKVRSRV